jgi:hypothetical protein
MFFPAPRQPHYSGDQTRFRVADDFLTVINELKYFGSIIHLGSGRISGNLKRKFKGKIELKFQRKIGKFKGN